SLISSGRSTPGGRPGATAPALSFSDCTFSSSLSFRNGDGVSLRSTAGFSENFGRCASADDCMKPCLLMPASVDDRKYTYLPPASTPGPTDPVMPSVPGTDLFCSSEYGKWRLPCPGVSIAYASHFESCDQLPVFCPRGRPYSAVAPFCCLPLSRSSTYSVPPL